jgi:hypothetical protein
MTNEPVKPPAPNPKPRVVGYGFSCGSGPCKVFRVIDGTPLPKLPALPERETKP